LPKNIYKVAVPVALGLAVPVLALTGCPFPGATGSPSPSPSASASSAPALRTAVVLKSVYIDADTTKRSITLTNKSGAEADLSTWAVSYEYEEGGSLKMIHMRIVDKDGKAPKVANGTDVTFTQNTGCTSGNCIAKDAALGNSTADSLGLQATHGSLVLYKGVAAGSAATSGTMTDYVQYGTAKSYSHQAGAVTAGVWASKDDYATAPGAAGKTLSIKTAGGSNKDNWEVK
jgi:uncharacterized cupin superfamily protein